jgi:dTDP-4-amino-4,6-dideoxygalactose transaminase
MTPPITIPLSRPVIGRAEVEAVERVLLSGQLVCGPEVACFEREFASWSGARFGVAVGSGTAALELGLRALGVGPGDEVVVPSFTFIATANAVCMVGATPVFADVDPVTMCVSAATIEPVLSRATAAVIAVHLYGHPAPVDELAQLCARHDCALVEDAAQALGTRWRGHHVGTQGALGTFSFYPTKAMTTGEGGMVTTNNEALAARIQLIRSHGMRARHDHIIIGTNQRMTDMAAGIGRVQLARVEPANVARRANAEVYSRALAGIVDLPSVAPGAVHAFHQYTVQVDDRPRALAALTRAGVGYGLYYPRPCHLQRSFADRGTPRSLPHTERAASRAFSIPVRPDLTSEEREAVIAAVIEGARA